VLKICAVVLIVSSLSTHDSGTPVCVYVVKIRDWRHCLSLNSGSYLQDHICIVTPQKTMFEEICVIHVGV